STSPCCSFSVVRLFALAVAHGCLHSFPTRRSSDLDDGVDEIVQRLRDDLLDLLHVPAAAQRGQVLAHAFHLVVIGAAGQEDELRSEEHTSELQSRENLVCRLLLEKKNIVKWKPDR